MDEPDLLTRVTSDVDRGSLLPLRRLARRLHLDVRRLLADGAFDEIEAALDRATAVAASLVASGANDAASLLSDAFGQAYNAVFDAAGHRRSELQIQPEWLWREVIVRVEVLGAMAVETENWPMVRNLALIPNEGDYSEYYPYALRHGVIMCSRANLFHRNEDDRGHDASLLEFAQETAIKILSVRGEFGDDEDAILSRLCQFDALAALVAMGHSHTTDGRVFYTNFARFYSTRVQSSLRKLVSDRQVRDVLFDGDDRELSLAIHVLDRRARAEGWRFAGWEEISDPVVLQFLAEHQVTEEEIEAKLT